MLAAPSCDGALWHTGAARGQLGGDAEFSRVCLSPLEIVRAMTHVINQGMAMYWGTSRWSAMEIMVKQSHKLAPGHTFPIPRSCSVGCVCHSVCDRCLPCVVSSQEAYSVARQFNLIPPVCEQAEYHLFQREKVEVQLPELYHKIGKPAAQRFVYFI